MKINIFFSLVKSKTVRKSLPLITNQCPFQHQLIIIHHTDILIHIQKGLSESREPLSFNLKDMLINISSIIMC
ncbi:hypothetical protein CLV93_106131 [Prolixibacter denitrificans]|jgi:hypothetical protein|uniref:Uncharacterized protein n=1 Tax=Prolixibacter denitrificans TaxID=1541063 RepID=A0A2P8CBP5_9BACT|nr:hypothetical protein CLV93_106131 [Prolixibacter denitrificans]